MELHLSWSGHLPRRRHAAARAWPLKMPPTKRCLEVATVFRRGRRTWRISVPKVLRALNPCSSDDFLDLAEPWFRRADLGSFLPRPPLWDGLERGLELSDPTLDPFSEIRGDFSFRNEVPQQLSRLREVLCRFVPEPPVVREEVRDVSGVDRLAIAVRSAFHVVPKEQDDQVHEVLPSDSVDLQLLEDHVREGNRRRVEFQPSVAGFLSEQDVMAEFQPVEEDVDVEPILGLVVHEPSVAEEPVDHVVRLEPEALEHAADRPALTRVSHQVEIREEGRAFADASHAVQDRDGLRHVQRVCVNAEGTQDSQRRPLGLGRVDDCPRRAEEIGFSESHEGRFVWHDRTRVRRAASVTEPTADVGARRSQRGSRESLGPYKDAHVASLTNRNVRGKSLMTGRPVTGRGSGGESPWAKSTFLRDRGSRRPRKFRCSRDGPPGSSGSCHRTRRSRTTS